MIKRTHKFVVGECVQVTLIDFTLENPWRTMKTEGEIVALVDKPFGYDIRLNRPVQFKAATPFPITLETEIKYDVRSDTHSCDAIFSKEDFINSLESQLLDKLRRITSKWVFRSAKVLHTVPEKQVHYAVVYKPDGQMEIFDDPRQIPEELNTNRRVALSLPHHFGFTRSPRNLSGEKETQVTSGKELHFSDNRRRAFDLWGGFGMIDADVSTVFAPREGDIICGQASQVRKQDLPSYDGWFVCSRQLELLIRLFRDPEITSEYDDVVQNLIIPENTDNYYVSHELPLSRFAYAAIYLLAVRKQKQLPQEWNLPTKKMPGFTDQQPFEVWWPAVIAECPI